MRAMTVAAGAAATLAVASLAVGLVLAVTESSAPAAASPATSPPAASASASASSSPGPARALVPTAPARPATVPGIPCSLPAAGSGACVQLSAQRAWLVHDGRVASTVPIRTGRAGDATPVGRFSVLWKDADHWSTDFDAPMPYAVFFHSGDAFHAGSLTERSHGCVHLASAAAAQFYATLRVGDPVQVVR